MFKGFGIIALLLIGGGYLAGAIGGPSYSRTVGLPPSEVSAALVRLDIGAQPGSPGTDPKASGGVAAEIELERTPGALTWTVMSGEKIATQMTATLEPIDGGNQTRVTATVKRGDAPDDFVSPAFRSAATTMALFSMALESQLNTLTLPVGDPEKCQDLEDRFTDRNLADRDMQNRNGLNDAMGDTAKTMIRLSAMEAEMRRNGCNTNGNEGAFRPVQNTMGR